ncbi:MAG: DUF3015 family protein, partial [Deltaproteobacteria bacterium]|nr:DUF3015 family protein [Deltaproteobacteria bacterium]
MDVSRIKRNGILALLCLLGMGSTALAGSDAGCGLGSLIIKKNTVMSQTMASTTNGSFGSQFFGITSGTSNCNPSGFALVEKEQIFYTESNYQHLKVEMAKGEGENLLAFAQVLGCSDKAAPDFARMTKQIYQGDRLTGPRYSEIKYMAGLVIKMLHNALDSFAR